MYGNMYTNPYMTPQANLEKINGQIRELENLRNQYQVPQTPTNLTQNFQLAPNNASGIKYLNTDEEVKKELVFNDTAFINKEYSILWVKKADGSTKKYELSEIIEKDEKDAQIEDLKAKIEEMEKRLNAKSINADVDEPSYGKKSSTSKSIKSNDE